MDAALIVAALDLASTWAIWRFDRRGCGHPALVVRGRRVTLLLERHWRLTIESHFYSRSVIERFEMARAADSTKRPPEVPTDDEVRALIDACSVRAPTGIRNRALLAVMWRCGPRIAEALALQVRDVDLDAGTLRIRHGKGDKARVVGMDTKTAALVARWIDRRKALGHNGRKPLFCKLDGGPIDQSYVRHLLRRLAAKAGVERNIHPHMLRHAYAVGLAREGAGATVIRDALGHSSLAVTDRYLRGLHPEHVIRATQDRDW